MRHDCGEENVLSYLYETKEHRAFNLRQQNENRINLMRDQFTGQGDILKQEQDLIAKFSKEKVNKFDHE